MFMPILPSKGLLYHLSFLRKQIWEKMVWEDIVQVYPQDFQHKQSLIITNNMWIFTVTENDYAHSKKEKKHLTCNDDCIKTTQSTQ